MPNNYVLLDRIELNNTAASVTFDNIPQTGYTDLKIVASVRDDYASVSVNLGMKINGSSTGMSAKLLFGSGSGSGGSGTATDGIGLTVGSTGTANTFSTTEVYIPNYTSSSYKSYSADSAAESNTTTVYMQMLAGLWSNNSAITSLTIYPINATNFVAGSSFSLYGIAQVGTTPAVAPKADGGNVITTDGTYWYHAFLSNGTFTPQVGLTADVLVVAGGGGGGGYVGGGGGAGGLLAHTSQSLTSTNYSITVGGGGAGAAAGPGDNGTIGQNSQFASLTASVGGGFGSGYSNGSGTGGNGGSGGGATQIGTATGGSPTSGQGFKGGDAQTGSNDYPSGGGGGAGAAGGNNSGGYAGNGGIGSSVYSSWGLATNTGQNVSGTVYYAGGGGGGVYRQNAPVPGSGGNGGGGAGGATPTSAGNNATTNTGGGGGGATSASSGTKLAGGNGGSGIVIIRYPVA